MARIDQGKGKLWLRHAFLLPETEENLQFGSMTRRRRATSAAFKFTNTSLGGNYTINNPPQFTPTADIRQPGRGRREEQRFEGMGRYYSEAIDDPKQEVHLTFGVPRFSSWTSFFTNFYDRNAALLANTGRVSSTWYNAGLAGGYVVSLPLQPFILGFTAVSRVYHFLAKQQPSKWYYFKPTMHAYWSAVNVIANEIAIGINLIPRVLTGNQTDLAEPGQQVTEADIQKFHETFPSIYRADGGIDVMSLASRTQRMSVQSQAALRKLSENAQNLEDLRNAMEVFVQEVVTDPVPNADARQYFLDYIAADVGDHLGGTEGEEKFSEWSDLSGVYDFLIAAQRDGNQFATFRVNHVGSVSESFSNSTRESEVASMLNTKVSQGRSFSFNFMGGNVTTGISSAVDAIKSFGAGVLDSVNLGGLATLAGTAFIDVPEMWDGSTANLPRADYTVPLYSPYGNPLSRYINMYIPIAMLLAGALPLSAGRSAYTRPFLCQVYHQGRVQNQLGIIDSLTITRGTGNVGWNAENQMLGAEVSFSVINLSKLMHMPIKGGFHKGDLIGSTLRAGAAGVGEALGGDLGAALGLAATSGDVWDEQSLFSDYMAVLSSMSVADNYYVGRRLDLNMTRAVRAFKTWRSPSNFMSWVLDGTTARTLSAFAQTSERF